MVFNPQYYNGDRRNTVTIIAVDIGAGAGTRIAWFSAGRTLGISSINGDIVVVPREKYGETYRQYRGTLIDVIESVTDPPGVPAPSVSTRPTAIGISTPGILKGDGSFQRVHNLPHFEGHNLTKDLRDHFGLPVGIDNDANAGALAEWNILQTELLYWVFGGGWGGAWISSEGEVKFPVRDWDGIDGSMHPTTEPGFVVPLEKEYLRELLAGIGGAYDRLETLLRTTFEPKDGIPAGPDGNRNTLRAEVVLSGPGRARLFQAISGRDQPPSVDRSTFPSLPNGDFGEYITSLSQRGDETAVVTDRIFGSLFGEAARRIITAAEKEGLPSGAPVCIGGKPSRALPYFGPRAQIVLAEAGLTNYLRPSVIDEQGGNANLIGAAVIGKKAYQAVRLDNRPSETYNGPDGII